MAASHWFRLSTLIALLLSTHRLPALPVYTPQGLDDPVHDTDRMVILTAEVSLDVRNCQHVVADAIQTAGNRGGFITTSEFMSDRNRPRSAKIVLRIPAGRFEEALADLRQGAWKIEGERVFRHDVIDESADLAARLEGRKLVEQRYAQVLHSAKSAKEILEVEQELTKVREEMEQIAARQKDVADRVTYATITVTMHEPARPCRCRRR